MCTPRRNTSRKCNKGNLPLPKNMKKIFDLDNLNHWFWNSLQISFSS